MSLSMRFMSVAALALVALSSVACAPASSYEEAEGEEAGSSGTCESTCTHYLTCKGASSAANQKQCVTDCKGMNLSSADMASFEQSDCATAITMVEGNGGATSTGSSTGSAATTDKECQGCHAYGDSCVWASESDWGKGAYSGAVIDCEARCCQ